MRAAAIQLNSSNEKASNLERAGALVAAAAAAGADLIVLPEKWNLLATGDELAAGAEQLESGPSLGAAREWARDHGVYVLAGSIGEIAEGDEDDRIFNTSCLVDRSGEMVAVYRKIHMFDVDVGGVRYEESAREQPGAEIVSADVDGVELGLTICYDLRFCELYRILAVAGARIFSIPSAFTLATGRDHWDVLLRARAIENAAFVIAPNQIGETPPHYSSYGRSAIVDPWGVVLAQAPDEECFVSADLDFEAQDRIRESLPALANRRPQAYLWPDPVEAASDRGGRRPKRSPAALEAAS
jgi:deaminated glutathione amidase